MLTDDSKDQQRIPTYDNIVGAMRWLVEGAKSGDSLFLHYSGMLYICLFILKY